MNKKKYDDPVARQPRGKKEFFKPINPKYKKDAQPAGSSKTTITYTYNKSRLELDAILYRRITSFRAVNYEDLADEIEKWHEAEKQKAVTAARIDELQFVKQSASDNITFSGWEEDVNNRIAQLTNQEVA